MKNLEEKLESEISHLEKILEREDTPSHDRAKANESLDIKNVNLNKLMNKVHDKRNYHKKQSQVAQ